MILMKPYHFTKSNNGLLRQYVLRIENEPYLKTTLNICFRFYASYFCMNNLIIIIKNIFHITLCLIWMRNRSCQVQVSPTIKEDLLLSGKSAMLPGWFPTSKSKNIKIRPVLKPMMCENDQYSGRNVQCMQWFCNDENE